MCVALSVDIDRVSTLQWLIGIFKGVGGPSHQDPKVKEGPGPLLGPTGLS